MCGVSFFSQLILLRFCLPIFVWFICLISDGFFISLLGDFLLDIVRRVEKKCVFGGILNSWHIALLCNFSWLFWIIWFCRIFIQELCIFLPSSRELMKDSCLLRLIMNCFMIMMKKWIVGVQQEEHHEVFYFNSNYFSRRRLDFKDMIFQASIQNDHWQVNFLLNFRRLKFIFYWSMRN